MHVGGREEIKRGGGGGLHASMPVVIITTKDLK